MERAKEVRIYRQKTFDELKKDLEYAEKKVKKVSDKRGENIKGAGKKAIGSVLSNIGAGLQ